MILSFDNEKLSILIELITKYPNEDADKKRCQNHPFMASEVLGEVSPLHDKIAESPELLSQLCAFLDDETLDATLVGYFCKVVIAMISRSPEKYVGFLGSGGRLERIAKHTSHRGFYDIGIKILMLDSIQYPSLLASQSFLITNFIKLLTQGKRFQVLNCSNIIIDFIIRSAENMSKDLIEVLISDPSIQTLFTCLQSEDSFRVVASVNILNTLLQANLRVSLKTVTEHYFSGQVFQDNLTWLIKVLRRPKSTTKLNTMKLEYEPLGEDRLKVVELVSVLTRIPDDNLIQVLANSGIFEAVQDLFFTYPWHSFLHNIFENIVAHVINSQNEVLIQNAVLGNEFLQKVFRACTEQQGKHRPGLLGVVHKIANMIKNSGNPLVFGKIAGNEMWANFVDGYLEKRNKLDYLQLGDISRKIKSSSCEDVEIANGSDEDKRVGEVESEKVDGEDEKKENCLQEEGKVEDNEKKDSGAHDEKPALEICIEENDYSVDSLNKKSPLAKRRHSGGQLSPCGNPEYNHANFWNVPILVDELDGLDFE